MVRVPDRAEAAARAARCFAIARSAAGDRHGAVARGEAIVRAAGLDLDDFDVPGRWRPGQGRAS